MEADMYVKLQVIPVPYAVKHATYGEKNFTQISDFLTVFYFIRSK